MRQLCSSESVEGVMGDHDSHSDLDIPIAFVVELILSLQKNVVVRGRGAWQALPFVVLR
jgi:hypothetical protein